MTPEERELVTELFDRLATLENAPRDPDAERLIIDGLRRAPNATYALVQTTLVQDEALKRADARIRELEAQGRRGAEPRDPAAFSTACATPCWAGAIRARGLGAVGAHAATGASAEARLAARGCRSARRSAPSRAAHSWAPQQRRQPA